MPRVLLVDDDPGTLQGWDAILRDAGFDVLMAECGLNGLALARDGEPDVILADLRLPDMSGLEFLRQLRRERLTVPVVVVTGFASVQTAVDAIKLGAIDFVEKPLIGEDVVRAVELGLLARRQPVNDETQLNASMPEPHAASRWASAVARIADARHDPKTVEGWSRVLCVSVGTLKNWCRMAGLSPKRSLDLGRLLRAVVRHNKNGLRPEDSLDIVDRRTLKRLLSRVGSKDDAAGLPQQVETLLDTQVLIRNEPALVELKRHLRSRAI